MAQPKSFLSRAFNILSILIGLYVVYNLSQQYYAGEKISGRSIEDMPVKPLEGEERTLGAQAGPKVVVFWATWCGPCTLELSRLNNLVKEGEVNPKQIFAVSVGEGRATVSAAAKERDYAFPVYWDEESRSSEWIPISATPTVAYVGADNKVTDVDTGINPVFSLKVGKFLKPATP